MTKQRTPANFYAESGLDRAAHLRAPADWLERMIESGAARIVPVWRSKNLIAGVDSETLKEGLPALLSQPSGEPAAAYLEVGEAIPLLEDEKAETVFLGERDSVRYIAIDLSHQPDPQSGTPAEGAGAFVDLRAVGPLLDRNDGAVLAYARGMMTWHRRHRYCGLCGAPTNPRGAGHLRVCTNEQCGTSHFPRTDPAVIMLVTRGDQCLLGRQAVWPKGMHSTLAGFVEPGETLEAAVAREVVEESGIHVENVRYHSSQPWPFPSSVMLGFHADAITTDISINDNELEAAIWFQRDWLRENDGVDGFRLPRKDSIARRLIEDWMAGEV